MINPGKSNLFRACSLSLPLAALPRRAAPTGQGIMDHGPCVGKAQANREEEFEA
jgi:hypothetical protein